MDLSLNLTTPVILCGGFDLQNREEGDSERPKPFQKLAGNLSRFQQTLLRVSDPNQYNPAIIVANEAHRNLVEFEIEMIGVEWSGLVCEPVSRGTAPSLGLAALVAGAFNPSGSLLVLPCDHLVRDPDALNEAVRQGLTAAHTGAVLAFGRQVARGDEGHSWLQWDCPLDGEGPINENVYRLEKYVPKSDSSDLDAQDHSDTCVRSSGMYLFPTASVLRELQRHAPEVLTACQQALVGGGTQGNVLTPSKAPLEACPEISINQAIMARTDCGGVVNTKALWVEHSAPAAPAEDPAEAIAEPREDAAQVEQVQSVEDAPEAPAAPTDSAEPMLAAPAADTVILRETTNCEVRSEGPITVVAGLDDVVVVTTGDTVIVSAKSYVGRLLEAHENGDEHMEMQSVPSSALDMLRDAVRGSMEADDDADEAPEFKAPKLESAEQSEATPEDAEAHTDEDAAINGWEISAQASAHEEFQPELPFPTAAPSDEPFEDEPPLLLHAALETAA